MAEPISISRTPGALFPSLSRDCNIRILEMLPPKTLAAVMGANRICEALVKESCLRQVRICLDAQRLPALGDRSVLEYTGLKESLSRIPISIWLPAFIGFPDSHPRWIQRRGCTQGSVFCAPYQAVNSRVSAVVSVFLTSPLEGDTRLLGFRLKPDGVVTLSYYPTEGQTSDGGMKHDVEHHTTDLQSKLGYCADLMRGQARGLWRGAGGDVAFIENRTGEGGAALQCTLDRPKDQQPHLAAAPAEPPPARKS